MQGVYALKVGNGYYIGSSKDVKKRFSSHKSNLKCNKHVNKNLQKAYDDTGIVELIVIKEVAQEKLLTYFEGIYIDYYKDTKMDVYNYISNFTPDFRVDTTVIVYELLIKLDIPMTELSKRCGLGKMALKLWMTGKIIPTNWNISKLYRYYFEVFGELPKVYRSCSNCKYLNKKNECKKDWVYYKRDIYLKDDYLKDTIHTQNCDYYKPSVYNKAKIDRLYEEVSNGI